MAQIKYNTIFLKCDIFFNGRIKKYDSSNRTYIMKWAPIKTIGVPCEINNRGEVRELRYQDAPEYGYLPVPVSTSGNGYLTLTRFAPKRQQNYYIHSLVGKHFVPNPHGYRFLHFKDGDKRHVHAHNLQWVRLPTHRVLTEKTVKQIRSMLSSGHPVSNVAKRFKVSQSTIYMIRRGKRWA